MPVKIRLQRQGKKGKAFFHLVVADGRAPRDGKFIEKLGTYNPNSNPATIDIDFEKTLDWYTKGAQPSDTAKAILSYKGILYKYHLLGGVKKGAFSAEQADAKFAKWNEDKQAKIEGKKSSLETNKAAALKKRMADESKRKEAIAAKIAAKVAPVVEAEAPAAATEENSAEA